MFLSAPRSNVRIVTGRPANPTATDLYASNCSSSDGSPRRLRNRNSLRNNPTPLAPASSTSRTSPGNSMFACSSTACPSSVVARFVLRRLSFCRSRSNSSCFSRYSVRIALSGLTITTECAPSTISHSFSRISARALWSATTAGMLRLLATIAVCDVAPPRSVRNAAK